MKLFSIWYHGKALIKRLILICIYRNKLKIGSRTTWRRNFSVLINKNGKIKIGKNCFFNNDCSLVAMNGIDIGDGTLLGENVKIYDHNHKFNKTNISIKDQGFSVAPVIIGAHCWIGSNVVILKGTHIGNNVVVGAGCIISQDIQSNTIVKQNNNVLEKIPLIVKK
ncbi:MAG: acyltransferase [Lactobacillus crispatus]|nr:acyltransferase [Lactobacillus crispatus]